MHEPGVVPVQVPGVGAWLVGLQVNVTGPWTEAAQALAVDWQALAPSHMEALAETSARR